MFLEREPDKQYALIMGDAFNDYSLPYHLTTLEFNERVRTWLAADGLYLVNLIEGPRRDVLRAFAATLARPFEPSYPVPALRVWRESPPVTFVVSASDQPLDLERFRDIDAGDGETLLADTVLPDADRDALLAAGKSVLLTDQYAPVDQMLAPVVRGETVRPDAPSLQGGSTPQ